jgi:hypothetical protein
VVPDEEQPPMLDYATRPDSLLTRFRRWYGTGEDTFLGSSALTVGLLAIFSLASLTLDRGFALTCLGLPLCVMATILGISGLLQPHANKTFPLVTLLLVCVYVCILIAIR